MTKTTSAAQCLLIGLLFAVIATSGTSAQAFPLLSSSSSATHSNPADIAGKVVPVAKKDVLVDHNQNISPKTFINNWDKLPSDTKLNLLDSQGKTIASMDSQGLEKQSWQIAQADINRYEIIYPDSTTHSIDARDVIYSHISTEEL